METYSTSEIAEKIGIHPNTVMLYEKWGYLPPVERKENGYRVYTETHLDHMKLARLALRSDFVKCYMRIEVRDIIRSAAKGELEKALVLCKEYLVHIQKEKENEFRVLGQIVKILKEDVEEEKSISLKRTDTANLLGVSINVLKNWEWYGMLEVPRNSKNRYRVYTEKEIKLLRVIKILRQENYRTQWIKRMANKLKDKEHSEEEIAKGSENALLSSIAEAERDAEELINYIRELMNKQQ